MRVSYEFSPQRILTVFGSASFKINPHSNSTNHAYAENAIGQQTYNYTRSNLSQTDNDEEYYAAVDYEHLFGEDAEKGKFYVGYNFYSRPIDRHISNEYTLLEYLEPSYVRDFYDTYIQSSNRDNQHVLTALYRRKFNGHQLYLEDFARYIDEETIEDRLKKYRYAATYKEVSEKDQYDYSQWANNLKIGYSYTASKLSFGVGANHSFIKASSKNPLLNNSYSGAGGFFRG